MLSAKQKIILIGATIGGFHYPIEMIDLDTQFHNSYKKICDFSPDGFAKEQLTIWTGNVSAQNIITEGILGSIIGGLITGVFVSGVGKVPGSASLFRIISQILIHGAVSGTLVCIQYKYKNKAYKSS